MPARAAGTTPIRPSPGPSVGSGSAGYFQTRRKQLDLVELAFLKRRRFQGEEGASLDRAEAEVRARVEQANAAGVFIGERP